MTDHDDMVLRFEAAKAVHKAISLIPGMGVGELMELVTPPTVSTAHNGLLWQVGIKTPAFGMVHIFEESDQGVRILKRVDGVNTTTFFQSDKPDVRTLSVAVTHALIGRGTVPPQSRRTVRDVLNAARRNAEHHFREGVYYLLSARDSTEWWAISDPSDRWDQIVGAFNQKTGSASLSFMHTWRTLGVPLVVIDIYEDAYIERAQELLATIGAD